MKLQILIPHWQETAEEMAWLLNSLAVQQAVDFKEIGIIIAYDGPEASELPIETWREMYPFQIMDIHPRKGGVSATRNAALDAATADYVMFCDADDMFCDVCGLYIVFREIDNGGFDTLVSCFREEVKDPSTGSMIFVNHDMDKTFVHGKIHKRKYLVENRIRFNPALTIHEDSYFNILAQELTPNGKYCPMAFYLWKWRDASICRHDKLYILKTYGNMLDSNDALVDEFVKRRREEKAMWYVGFMVMDAYYTMNKPEWRDSTNAEYRDAVEKHFARYFAKHRKQYERLSEQEKMQISVAVRQRSASEGMLMEAITLEQWLERVNEK